MNRVRFALGALCRGVGGGLVLVGLYLLVAQSVAMAQPPTPTACPYELQPPHGNGTTPCDEGCNGAPGANNNCATKGCKAVTTGMCNYCVCKTIKPPGSQSDPSKWYCMCQ